MTMLFIVLVLQNKTWAFIKLMYCISDKIVSLEKKTYKKKQYGQHKCMKWREKSPSVKHTQNKLNKRMNYIKFSFKIIIISIF